MPRASTRRRSCLRCAALLLASLGLVQAWAQSSASFQIPRSSIDAGGGRADSAAGTRLLQGSIGQPDAGAPMSAGSYTLRGGFQQRTTTTGADALFADGFES